MASTTTTGTATAAAAAPAGLPAAAAAGAPVSRRTHLAGLGGVAALALAALPSPGAWAADGPGADPAVITQWNATAVDTIVTDAGKANAEAIMWFGFVQAAVYNAVNGITRRYALYKWDVDGPPTASPQAAAAAAANRVLLTYFGHLPAARTRLADAYAASLARVPDGASKQQGIRYGELAADRFNALRVDDGRFAATSFSMPPAPGVWRPTPPAFAPFFDPWLGTKRPLLLTFEGNTLDWGDYNADPRTWGAPRNPDGTVRSGSGQGSSPGVTGWPEAFRTAGFPAMTSPTYAAEFNEVKALGSKTSALRTPAQTETALYISGIAFAPLQKGLRDIVTDRGMDISDSARLLAAVDMSAADAGGACWDCKLHFGFWRPITAIQLADQDGNTATEADRTWEPLIVTPPYPDYNSGLNSLIGSVTQALVRVLGTDRIDLTMTSPATNTTRRYEYAAPLRQDAVDARVWAGIHFRTADVHGLSGGMMVADWALDRYFHPR